MSDIVGYMAAFLTTLAFVPQAWHVIRTKNVDALSKGMYIIFTSGVFLWLVYGIMMHSPPIIIANFITLLLSGFILFRIFQASH
jgi:MtN3 and saliva related transmembrane protein